MKKVVWTVIWFEDEDTSQAEQFIGVYSTEEKANQGAKDFLDTIKEEYMDDNECTEKEWERYFEEEYRYWYFNIWDRELDPPKY